MKKIGIIVVIVVVALFIMGTDMVVNPFEEWVLKNQQNSAAPRLQYALAGYLYLLAQRQGKATEMYQTAFRLFPGQPGESQAHYRIGLYCESKKNYNGAVAEYQTIIQKWPDLAERLALSQRIDHFKALQGEAGNN